MEVDSLDKTISKHLEKIQSIVGEANNKREYGLETKIEEEKLIANWSLIQEDMDKIINIIQQEKENLKESGLTVGLRRADETIEKIKLRQEEKSKFLKKGDFRSLDKELEEVLRCPSIPFSNDIIEEKRQIERIKPFSNVGEQVFPMPASSSLEFTAQSFEPQDTMPSVCADITPEIREKAEELDKNPVRIFNFAKNGIKYVPYYGSMKGSQGVLYESSGNDCDKAGFLIALLRASGIPARFVRGTITLDAERAIEHFGGNNAHDVFVLLSKSIIPFEPVIENGEIIKFKIEWTWVKALIPYQRYGGTLEDKKGKLWLDLFPTLEKKNIELGLNIPGFINFDAIDFLRNYKKIHSAPFDDYKEVLRQTIEKHFPGKTYEDALMAIRRQSESFSVLPLTSPIEAEVKGVFSDLPSFLIWKIDMEVKELTATYSEGEQVPARSLLISDVLIPSIYSRNYSVIWGPSTATDLEIVESYGSILKTPPYLINVTPVLRINGKRVTEGNEGVYPGQDINIIFKVIEPYDERQFEFKHKGGVDFSYFFNQQPTDLYITNPPEHDTLQPIEKELYDVGMWWSINANKDLKEIAASFNLLCDRIYGCGIVTSNMNTLASEGIPIRNTWEGLLIDIFNNFSQKLALYDFYGTGNMKDFLFLKSLQSSYLENKVFEEKFEVEAISALKSIMVAESLGIPIYHISKAGTEPFILPKEGTITGGGGLRTDRKENLAENLLTSNDFPKNPIKQVIVKAKKGVRSEEIEKLGRVVDSDGRGGYLLEVEETKSAIDNLSRDKNIEWVEENAQYCATAEVIGIAPTDPYFSEQWAMRKILAPAVWDSTTGDSTIVIGILDTGIDTAHLEFKGRIVGGYDFVNDDPIAYDDHGHGTMVAGIIGAEGQNGVGIAGVGWKLKLMPVKVIDANGIGSVWTVGNGIRYAANNGAKVINMSLGNYEPFSYISEAIDSAADKGCILIASAGNDNTDEEMYPAAYPNVIAVAATDRYDKKASFSNYGDHIYCSAPGTGVFTTLLDNKYGVFSGTSSAAPFVSGMVGLLLSRYPTLSREQVLQGLQYYSDDIGETGWDPKFGHGRLNGFKLLFGDVPSYLVLSGWQIAGGNNNGYPERGETFKIRPIVRNTGVSETLRNVMCTISTDDPFVEISGDGVCWVGDVSPGEALVSIEGFMVEFSSDMPREYISRFNVTIQADGGDVYTDEFSLKEGDVLSVLDLPKRYRDYFNNLINAGYELIVPQRKFEYYEWYDIGLIARNPETGDADMILFKELFGGVTVVDRTFWSDNWIILTSSEACIPIECTPEILEPKENQVIFMDDEVDFKCKFTTTYLCYPGPDMPPQRVTVVEDAQFKVTPRLLTPPDLIGGPYMTPGELLFCAKCYWKEEEVCVPTLIFDFEIDEDNVTKYFNPYKPDSAKIKYTLLPIDYADPDISPSPLKMEVEIKDKDENVVNELRDLTKDEQYRQMLWWDGIDNNGDTIEVDKNPFTVEVSLRYKESSSTTSSTSSLTPSVLATNAEASDEKIKDKVDVKTTGEVYLDIFWANNNSGWGPGEQVPDEEEFDKGAIVDENDDHDGSPSSPDNENEEIEGGFGSHDVLDMVKLRLNYKVPESYVDEKLELTMEKLSNKDKEKLVRVFNEEGKVVSFPDKIELSRLKKGPIYYYVEGVEPGEWLDESKSIEPSKVKFRLSLLDSEGKEIESVDADSAKLEITDELIYYRYMTGYDCSPEEAIRNAFGEAEIVMGFRRDATIAPELYPKKEEELYRKIQIRYNWLAPWYLETGKEPEDEFDWCPEGTDPDSLLGIKLLYGPNNAFGLVFVERVKNLSLCEFSVGPTLKMLSIHELGHAYGNLSDKYLRPDDHDKGYNKKCVMDRVVPIEHGPCYKNKNLCGSFCQKCIEKLKNMKNYWDKEDK